MTAEISSTDFDFTTLSERHNVPNYQSNGIAAGCSADEPNYQRNEIGAGCSNDDECFVSNLCKLANSLTIKDHQNIKTTAGCINQLHLTKELNFPILSYSWRECERKPSYYCACNPFDTVQELMLTKSSLTEGQQNTKSPDIPTCRLQSKCTEWVENVFTMKYGSHFGKALVFAVDVLMVMRNLNGRYFSYIIYPTDNVAPISWCDEKMANAFALILKTSAGKIEKQFDDAMKGKEVNYKNFQNLLRQWSLYWEQASYKSKEFLIYCVTVGQWAVCAEKKGVRRACYFAPLVICRTIYRLEIWEKITPTFWTDLAEAAQEIIETYS